MRLLNQSKLPEIAPNKVASLLLQSCMCVLVMFFSCGGINHSSLHILKTKADFDHLSGLPLSEKYGQVSSVKVVYDLVNKKMYYLNSSSYKFHFDFCITLGTEPDLEHFNAQNYESGPRRRFLLGNINFYQNQDCYTLELAAVDLMSIPDIKLLWQQTKQTSFIGSKLKLLLNSSRLQALSHQLQTTMPVIQPSDIYQNLSYQAVSKYKNCGKLRIVENLKLEIDNLKPTDIIVIKETPLFLPNVAGIIVAEFQTPLSHLTLLGQNRKIPIMALKSAFNSSVIKNHANQQVCFEVTADTFKLFASSHTSIKTINQKPFRLKYDLVFNQLIDVEQIRPKSSAFIGNKAANFGDLYQLSKIHHYKVPENAFAIPFYFYDKHVRKGRAKNLIDSLLITYADLDNATIKIKLKEIRMEIERAAIDPQLIKMIDNKVQSYPNSVYDRYRFRSSTNAEDMEGFSGAGLYKSATGIHKDEKKSFEKAIKEVWSSLWSFEAFTERSLYNMNQADVYMGILVHRSFPSEAANGVAVTKNIYRNGHTGFAVNVQLGDESVVNPKKGVFSDQFICFPYNDIFDKSYEVGIEIIAQSNLNNGKMVMTDKEIDHLAKVLQAVKRYFYRGSRSMKSFNEYGLDIEFKLDGENRVLYLKQVRYYND